MTKSEFDQIMKSHQAGNTDGLPMFIGRKDLADFLSFLGEKNKEEEIDSEYFFHQLRLSMCSLSIPQKTQDDFITLIIEDEAKKLLPPKKLSTDYYLVVKFLVGGPIIEKSKK